MGDGTGHFIARILSMKAEEEGKPNPRMLKVEELGKPSAFLNGKPLSSLYTYYSALAHDSGVDTITFMCDDLEIPDLNIEQWISIIENNDSKVTWGSVPNEICREILFMCAKELDLKNPRLMGYRDFCSTRFECLNGKTLSGLYSYYSLRVPSDDIPVVQFICDSIGIEKTTYKRLDQYDCQLCHVQMGEHTFEGAKEIVMRAAVEMEIFHPRLMGSKEFDSVELKFLNNKTLSGLYYHYAAKLKDPAQQITEFIFNNPSIPRIDINPKTGRLATLDNTSHRKYFDSLANIKELINEYLKHYDLKSLCRKYTFINNAKKPVSIEKALSPSWHL